MNGWFAGWMNGWFVGWMNVAHDVTCLDRQVLE